MSVQRVPQEASWEKQGQPLLGDALPLGCMWEVWAFLKLQAKRRTPSLTNAQSSGTPAISSHSSRGKWQGGGGRDGGHQACFVLGDFPKTGRGG